MANKKITELDAITTLASTDVVPVVDVSADTTNKITTTNLFRTLPDGTAAAPALAFSSDQANGVYLAGTDTVGISTGGTQRVTVDGSGNVTISGDLTVSGATTTVESTTVTIDDKNIELGSVASPSNTTADGGGITLKGATDKTIKWINSTGYWTFNTGVEVGGHLQIDDNNKIKLGTSGDLEIYHNGSNSFIDDAGTGNLQIRASSQVKIQKYTGENMFVGIADGAASMYYDNSQKIATKSDGVDVTGEVQCDSLDVDGAVDITGNVTLHANLDLQDNDRIRCGTSDDLQIYHDGTNSVITNSTGDLHIRGDGDDIYLRAADDVFIQTQNGETAAKFIGNGAVELNYDDIKKFATKSDGVDITGELQCDSLDVDGAVDITGAVTLHANLDLQDSDSIFLGTGDDLRLFHNGSNSHIQNDGGGLFIDQNVDDGDISLRSDNGSGSLTTYVLCDGSQGSVKLNYLGSEKLQTKSDGIDVTGEVQCDSLDVDGNADITGDVSISGGNKTVKTTAGFLQVGTSSSNHLAFITDGSERGRIDSVGRLMLGTTTEGQVSADNFTVADGANCGITIRSGTTSEGAIYFSDGTSGDAEYRGQVFYDHDGDYMRFSTAATERFRINSNGAWAIEGASNYGTSGQVLTSNGNDAPTWQDAGQAAIGGSNAISMNDNVNINFGNGNDLRLYHNGSNSHIENYTGGLYIDQNLNDGDIHLRSDNSTGGLLTYVLCDGSEGSVKLYHYGLEKLNTKTDGVNIAGELECDSLDVDGNADFGGGKINFDDSGNVLDFADNVAARFGTGDDLQIYHDGSNSIVKDNGTGNLKLVSNGTAVQIEKSDGENMGVFRTDGAVELYHNNSKKFETKSDGIDVTGEVECSSLDVNGSANILGTTVFQGDVGIGNTSPGNSFDNGKALAFGDNDTGIRQNGDGILEVWSNNAQMFRFRNGGNSNQSYNHLNPSSNNSKDLGSSSLRWRNVYTNDLNLSNEGSTNDVDGTWGNYTIQEGEDDLFLINRRNGKKYKFNLTEVS